MFGLAVVRVCAMFAVLSARFGGVCMLGWFLGYWTLQKAAVGISSPYWFGSNQVMFWHCPIEWHFIVANGKSGNRLRREFVATSGTPSLQRRKLGYRLRPTFLAAHF